MVNLRKIIPDHQKLKLYEINSGDDPPVTLLNGLLVGFLILVGLAHNHAHFTMEQDADSYVRAWCKKNLTPASPMLTVTTDPAIIFGFSGDDKRSL